MKKKTKKTKKKKVKRIKRTDTKTYQAKQLRLLIKKCDRLWSLVVRKRAGNICEIGKFLGEPCSRGNLNAHHIESRTNKALRWEPKNGLTGCPGHHKFWYPGAHKSFLTVYDFIRHERMDSIHDLLAHKDDKVEFTKEYLENKIREFSNELYGNPYEVKGMFNGKEIR